MQSYSLVFERLTYAMHLHNSTLLVGTVCLGMFCMIAQPQIGLANTEGTKVIGHIIYQGKIPQESQIEVTKDRETCGPVKTIQRVNVLQENNGLQDAVVSVQAIQNKASSRPPDTIILANRDCLFSPTTLVGMQGDSIEIQNQDSILHNTHIKLQKRTILNVAQLSNSSPVIKRLKRSGMHNIRCDKHRFMEATLHVFSHSWFSVTDSTGAFHIPNVPPGLQVIQVWHEILGILEKKVIIPPNGTITVQFEYPNTLIN